jgi:hypothetical protein
MQIILQATHGIVSGSPKFFRQAFGESVEQYEALLLRPQHYLFNRFWYERYDGKAEFEAYQKAFAKLSADGRKELADLLSAAQPIQYGSLASRGERSFGPEALPSMPSEAKKTSERSGIR